ncbi:MAG: isocitrate/isopropylmalate family dehydrogenase, partial [Thermoanaerobaculia bacterium]
ANPTALLQSAVLMLQHIGENDAATRVYAALVNVLARGIRTRDLGGEASTAAFTNAICEAIQRG